MGYISIKFCLIQFQEPGTLQLALFWIATSWLAAGLYIAPAVSGTEPKFQRLGVNILFVALLIIVRRINSGEWMGVMQKLDFYKTFWFGHQGMNMLILEDSGRYFCLPDFSSGSFLCFVLYGPP